MVKKRRTFRTLQEYLDRTGTPQYVLARRMKMSQSALSMLLRGSRRCSLVKALQLSHMTGVPVDNLVKWPKFHDPDKKPVEAQIG